MLLFRKEAAPEKLNVPKVSPEDTAATEAAPEEPNEPVC